MAWWKQGHDSILSQQKWGINLSCIRRFDTVITLFSGQIGSQPLSYILLLSISRMKVLQGRVPLIYVCVTYWKQRHNSVVAQQECGTNLVCIHRFETMMMIAFITINSVLVPLIEGLCAQIIYFKFDIIGGLRSHFLLLFFERKNMLKETAVSPRSHPASQHIHTNVYFVSLYTYTNIYMPRFSPSGFFGPSRCLIPTPGLTSKYPICAVCVYVCVYTHIHPHTLLPASEIEKTQTTPLSLHLSYINPHVKQLVPS